MTAYLRTEDDGATYEQLVRLLGRGDLILFAGSGLSAQASTADQRHPPDWEGLLEGMVDWSSREGLIDTDRSNELRDFIHTGFMAEAGQELQESLEPGELRRCMEDVLLCREVRTAQAHRLVTRIPFRGYLTTNYDQLVEGEYRVEKGIPLPIFYERTLDGVLDAFRAREPFIFKLHGDINDPNSIVLGMRSYDRLVYGNSRYRACLETIFATSSVLFLGFGGSDPNLDAVISRTASFDGRSKRHWILLPEGRTPPLKAKSLWRDRGVTVIQYRWDKDHTGLVRFLSKLAKMATPAVAPSALAREDGGFERLTRFREYGK